MDVLKNMSSPPKSRVVFSIDQIESYILFNPNVLKRYFNVDSDELLSKKIEEYVKNSKTIDKVKKPSGYMISNTVINDDDVKYEKCKDIDLLIIVFTHTIDKLYIPNKEMSFSKSRFMNKLYFLKSEVLS